MNASGVCFWHAATKNVTTKPSNEDLNDDKSAIKAAYFKNDLKSEMPRTCQEHAKKEKKSAVMEKGVIHKCH